MAKGSQLAQLKSTLSEAGLSRELKSSRKIHKRSRAVKLLEKDNKLQNAKKLRDIHERLNPFDAKITKLKHDVGGRKLKGVTGRPGFSKQAGIEQRKKTLLVEYDQKNHAGGILDRRFGENDPSMAPEERMLERFTRERQRVSKEAAFNLEDEDLTHYGNSLSAMDDFDGLGLDFEAEEENGQIDGKTVGRTHFGGFDDGTEDSDDEKPARKKSKAEVMAEIIAKSKEHKYQRQMEKKEDENARFEIDQDFDTIRGLIYSEPGPGSTGSNAVPLGARPALTKDTPPTEKGDREYDQFVRELAFEKRAKPKDRTKTEEELALEEKGALERAEKARLRRMMGMEDDNDGNEEALESRKRKRQRGGDDLETDFIHEDMSGGLGLGMINDEGDEYQDHTDESALESENGATDTSEENGMDPYSGGGSESEHVHDASSLPLVSLESAQNGTQPAKAQDIPFTFPCPASHGEFLTILKDIVDADVPTVVQRIRSLHHPSLAKDNPVKLQALVGVLVDHIVHIAYPPVPKTSLLEALVPHIYALTQSYPIASAQAFITKLSLMQKNLIRGLSNGAASPGSRIWPGPAELCLLRVLGVVWSTSDMNHAVVSPARVLMGAYLSLGRIRSVVDLASGLFLCTMFLQFEQISKRFVPEAINFLINAVLHMAPHPFKDSKLIPGSFPLPDFRGDATATLKLNKEATKGLEVTRPDLISILSGQATHTVQIRLDLLGTALQLLGNFAEFYKSLDGFGELCAPVLEIICSLTLEGFPAGLQKRWSILQDVMSRLLKFFWQSRRPLLLQAHKPIAIPSYIPKFSTTSSNFLRKQDPDQERAASSKLRNQVKQERKGAIRELRKDSRFLAGVQQKRQVEETSAYKEKMKIAFGSIEGERAEQKALERERTRKRRRAGPN